MIAESARPRIARNFVLWVFVAITVAACAISGPASIPDPVRGSDGPPQASRTLVMAVANEPDALTAATGVGANLASQIRLFNAGVALLDSESKLRPYLVEALPELSSDSWQVFPDGRMQTTYRLRPNLTWHDGAALEADDFVFAWRVYATPELGVAGRPPQTYMDEVLAPDPRTVIIRWRQPYPHANALTTSGTFDFPPLPRHILEQAVQHERPETLRNHSYWTTDYVALGPYRLDRWESGAFLEAVAFGGHALGRPKIDRLRVVFIRDSNAALANVLAGDVHVTDETPLTFTQALLLRREWAPRNAGSVLFVPNLINLIQVQLKQEIARPRALSDLSVRKALAHLVDKQALNDGLFEGEGLMTDAFAPPTARYYPEVERAIAKYPYDPRRAEQLLAEAGFVRAGDGIHANATERMALEIRFPEIAEYGQATPIILDSYRRAGVDASMQGFPSNQIRDGQFRSGFSGLDFTGGGASESSNLQKFSSSNIPRPETRWTGSNWGGWANPEFDRLVALSDRTLDPAQRDGQLVQIMKLLSEEIPAIAVYFVVRPIAHAAALQGPRAGTPQSTRFDNVHEWTFR